MRPIAAKLSENQLLGYIGGIIDGEGYIGITASTVKGRLTPVKLYTLCVSVSMTTTEAIEALIMVFGGEDVKVIARPPYKRQYVWRLRKREYLRHFVEKMERSMCVLVKRKQLLLAKEFLDVTENRLQDPELREAFYQKFKILNGTENRGNNA